MSLTPAQICIMFFLAGTGPLLSDNMRRRELFSHDRKIPENQAFPTAHKFLI